jgi:hypothetical protein
MTGMYVSGESPSDTVFPRERSFPGMTGRHPCVAFGRAGALPSWPASFLACWCRRNVSALTRDPEVAWARVNALIDTRKPGDYDAAVDLLKDLQAVAQHAGHVEEFIRRFGLLRRQHHRKPSLIARFDRAGLAVASTGR